MRPVQHYVICALFLLALENFVANGYTYSCGPIPRNPRESGARNKQSDGSGYKTNKFYRFDQNCVDEAFRDLQDELGGRHQEPIDWIAAMVDPFETGKFPVDKKIAKKWIEKAFDFAFEFNEDFATVQEERDATEEFLRKSRDWVAHLYEEGEEEDDKDYEEYDDGNNNNDDDDLTSWREEKTLTEDSKSTEARKSKNQQTRSVAFSNETEEIVSETPNSEDVSTKDIFRVSIDLPGVERTDIDISLDDISLLIRAKRNGERDGLPTRMYTKKLPVSENEVDLDQMRASIKNGVLIISAPKQKPIESRRKIPVS